MSKGIALVAIAIVALFPTTPVSAVSSGDTSLCQAKSPLFGCNEFINNNRLQPHPSCDGQVMWWTLKPNHTDKYSFRSGNSGGFENDPIEYIPGTVMTLYLTVNDYDWKYRGFLVHAENSMNDTVGSWEQVPGSEQLSWSPPRCPNAVLHLNAEEKPFRIMFKFRTPEAGTGNIWFRTLIKRGPANTGSFHYANSYGDLYLREWQPPSDEPVPAYQIGEVGESCHKTCMDHHATCSYFNMARVTAENFFSTAGLAYPCPPAVMTTCSKIAPAVDNTTGDCFVRTSACTEPLNASCSTGVDTECSISAPSYRRFCSCLPLPTSAPTAAPIAEAVSTGNIVLVSWGFDVSAASTTIRVGDTVTWTFDQDSAEHDVVSGTRGSTFAGILFRSELRSGGTFSHTFNTVGTFPYFCTPHANMNAAITVIPVDSAVHTISYGFDMSGASISINVGDTVSWEFDQDTVQHNVVSGWRSDVAAGSIFESPLMATGSFSYTFTSAGEFHYHCTPHANMNGIITVVSQRRNRFARNGASVTQSNLITATLLTTAFAAISSRGNAFVTTALLGSVFSMVAPTSAHNWQISPGRARNEASATAPCRARKDTDLHAQVGPNQDFVVQWASGHNRDATWVIVHEDNYHWLRHRDFKRMVNDYLASAPPGSDTSQEPLYKRAHGTKRASATWTCGQTDQSPKYPATAQYEGPIAHNSERFRKLNHTQSMPTHLCQYTDNVTRNDKRISYESEAYPWLEAVYRYEIVSGAAFEFDTVPVTVPARSGAGHYVVHWFWSGYYDCTDVDVRSEPVPEDKIYGIDLGTYRWERIDHCQYVEPRRQLTGCYDASEGAAICRDLMDTGDHRNSIGGGVGQFGGLDKSYGINVVPLVNSETAIFDRVHVDWSNSTCSDSEWTRLNGTDSRNSVGTSYAGTAAQRSCMSSPIFVGELRDAVSACTPDECLGVVWDASRGVSAMAVYSGSHNFWLCRNWDGTPAAGFYGFTKDMTRYAAETFSTFPGTSSIFGGWSDGDMIFADFSQAPPAQGLSKWIDFSPAPNGGNRPEFPLPATTLRDHGDEFADRGNGFQYGWSCQTNMYQNRVYNENSTSVGVAFNLGYNRGEKLCPNGDRVKWEIVVPNGIYNVTYYAALDNIRSRTKASGCFMENIRATYGSHLGGNGPIAIWKTVEVKDGRFTFAGETIWEPEIPAVPSQIGCEFINKIHIHQISDQPLKSVWAPKSTATGAWWQRELTTVEPIGLVSIKLPRVTSRAYDCRHWWFYDSHKCPKYPPAGWFTESNQGAIISVANEPCTTLNGCQGGHVCSRFTRVDAFNRRSFSIGSNPYPNEKIHVDCGGVAGLYVRIHLPGAGRIIELDSVEVNRAFAQNVTSNSMACFGLEAREKKETEPEYIITDDPLDPVFYSTCYERKREFQFLPIADTQEPEEPRFTFHGECVECDSYISNLEQTDMEVMRPIHWKMSDQCFDCSRSLQALQAMTTDTDGIVPSTYTPINHIVSWGFNVSAASITVTVGDTVTWLFNQDQVSHDIVSGSRDDYNTAGTVFRSALQADGNFSHTFNTTGSVPYFCTPHEDMNAMITVLALPQTSDDANRVSIDATTLPPLVQINLECALSSEADDSNSAAVIAVVVLVMILFVVGGIVLYKKVPNLRRNATSYSRHKARPGIHENPFYEQANPMYDRDTPKPPMPQRKVEPVVKLAPAAPVPPSRPVPSTKPVPPVTTTQTWEALVDDETGDVYFVSNTGDTQWECPYGKQWSAAKDAESGDIYYLNTDTGNTQWEQPGAEQFPMNESEI